MGFFENNILYFVELGILLIFMLVGILILRIKQKKGILKLIGIAILVYIIIFGITFIFEKPKMKTQEVANIEVKSIKEEIKKPTTMYHFRNVTNNVKINGNIDTEKIGEYKVQYELKTIVGTYTKEAKVKVVDTKAPEIILEGAEEYKQSYSKEYEEPGYKAIDEYEGDITDKVKVTKENINETNFNIKYEVQDSSKNSAEKVRKVQIVDDIPPVITLNGNSSMTVYLNNKYEVL